MADNILTPHFRAAYVSVFRATAVKNADGTTGKPKYSIRACFPSGTNLSDLENEAKAAAKDKWGDKMPKSIRSPFRKNEELNNPIVGIGDDWTIMTFSANEDRRPGLVDARRQDIIDEQDVYSGAWFRAQIRAFAYEQAGNRGVSFGLQNLQKVKDDDPIGGSRIAANKAFDDIETGAQSAGDLFK